MDELAIIGCGGHARSVADVLVDNNSDINIVFFDENAHENEKIWNQFDVKPWSEYSGEINRVFIALGDSKQRKKYYEKLYADCTIQIINVLSKRAYISEKSIIGRGVYIAEGAHIGPEVVVGNGSIINTHCVVDHESIVGEFSHISVNSTICGRCHIGNEVFIGAGAVVKDYIDICDNVVVGANAIVCKNISLPGIYVGCPAHRIDIQ